MTTLETTPLDVFQPFPKMARLSRGCVVTEKIDGTNAQVIVCEDGRVLAASRTRMITPEDDNYGFARWVAEHEAELRDGLGVGRHYGEWWGCGIQRRYGLQEKRFSLFNTGRWIDAHDPQYQCGVTIAPDCCHVVPVLWQGIFDMSEIFAALADLAACGSHAAPGFMRPEGIVIYHAASRMYFKKTLEKDDEPKSLSKGN